MAEEHHRSRSLNIRRKSVTSVPKCCCTPLHACACHGTAGHREIARHIMDHGANRLLKDWLGRTPLDKARHYGHTEMARLLEEHVASPPAAAQGTGQVRPPRPLCAATCAALPAV